MNKRCMLWANPKQAIYWITAILLFIGCVNVYSASYIQAQSENLESYYYLKRYIIFTVVGIGAIYAVRRWFSYKFFMQPHTIIGIYGLSVVLLVMVRLFGHVANGARRWISIAGITFQPSEVVKILVILMAAAVLARFVKQGRIVPLLSGFSIKIWGLIGIPLMLVAFQPDKGTAGIIAGLAFGVFIAAGIGVRQLTIAGISSIVLIGLVALSSDYSTQRLHSWLDPWSDPQGSGYQTVQSLLSIGSGGITGVSWGGGFAKFHYLPEAHTDFAFAVFCQETGLVGALILIALFLALGYAFLQVAFNSKSEKDYLLVSGLMLYVVGQACANMAMVCGLLPVIGVPLPLISYGGTSMLTTMGAIGLVLSVYDDEVKHELEDRRPPEERRQDLQFVESGRRSSRE